MYAPSKFCEAFQAKERKEEKVIIIIGPDQSGKTTLAQKFEGLTYFHHTKESTYGNYLEPLCNLSMFDAALDRFIFCEYPYSAVMNRKFQFTTKQWHNIILLALIQNPVIVLCTHKPPEYRYTKGQYMPYNQWDHCLDLYRRFFILNHINYIEYDYACAAGVSPGTFEILEARYRGRARWWFPFWKEGYGAVGSPHPKVLLVAERLGPNNMNSLPFETGPTGHMLSNMLEETKTPLGDFAVTNIVKAPRGDDRQPNVKDLELFELELTHMNPAKVVFMGSPAKIGIKVVKNLGIDYDTIVHLGSYYHRGIRDMSGYHAEWKRIIGDTKKLELM